MAKFDLISEDDFFSTGKKEEAKPEPPEKVQPDEDLFAKPLPEEEEPPKPEEDFSAALDGLVDEQPTPAPTAEKEEITKDDFDFGSTLPDESTSEVTQDLPPMPELEPELPDQGPEEIEEEPLPAEEPIDFYDDKQEGINYKPIIIGILAVVVVAVLGYFAYSYFFGGQETVKTVSEKKAVEKAQQPAGPSPEELRIAKFYSELSATNGAAANEITGLAQVAGSQTTLSSLLFYGNDFSFDVFAKNRDELARLNIRLKEQYKKANLQIISSEKRPGSNGGVLAVYKMKISTPGAQGKIKVTPFKSINEAQSWLSSLASTNRAKQGDLKTRNLGERQGFDVKELDVWMSGTRDNLLQLISAVGGANRNIKIYKLSMGAVNKKTFNKKHYQMRLILRLYL